MLPATLLEFSQNKLGIRPGITTVLHTWGQNLLDHYHLHGIVTGGGPRQVLGYLSRYTHRIAIGNHRILALDRTARTVTFAYKDYAQDAKRKTMTLHLDEFLRRFCLHILPPRFVKIRHYGLLANRGRDSRIEQARKLLADQETRPAETSSAEVVPEKRPACPQLTCPHCGSLRLLLVDIIQPQHSHGTAPPYPDTS